MFKRLVAGATVAMLATTVVSAVPALSVDAASKKVDLKELAAALERLPEEEKLKIFYMINGIELVRLDKVTA